MDSRHLTTAEERQPYNQEKHGNAEHGSFGRIQRIHKMTVFLSE